MGLYGLENKKDRTGWIMHQKDRLLDRSVENKRAEPMDCSLFQYYKGLLGLDGCAEE
jgi:hypothetical protein